MGLENKHQEEMRLMKLEVNNIILAYNLEALDYEKVSILFIYRKKASFDICLFSNMYF